MRLLLPLVSDFGLFTVNKKVILLGRSSEIEPAVRFLSNFTYWLIVQRRVPYSRLGADAPFTYTVSVMIF